MQPLSSHTCSVYALGALSLEKYTSCKPLAPLPAAHADRAARWSTAYVAERSSEQSLAACRMRPYSGACSRRGAAMPVSKARAGAPNRGSE